MRPQKQLYRHQPAAGTYGDCHRTAIAIVLDLNAAEVPHYMDPKNGEPDQAHDLFEAWLNERGICTINMIFPGVTLLSDLLHSVSELNRRSRPVFILGGESRNGTNHSVVCCDGKIVCDPSQNDSGIIGPCSDGYYWVTFFGHLQAGHPIKRPASAVPQQAAPAKDSGETVIVKCERCKDPFRARVADRKRGWGRFCSKSCKAIKQEQRTSQNARYHARKDSYRPDHDDYASMAAGRGGVRISDAEHEKIMFGSTTSHGQDGTGGV